MDDKVSFQNRWQCNSNCVQSSIIDEDKICYSPTRCISEILKYLLDIANESGPFIILLVNETFKLKCSDVKQSIQGCINPFYSENIKLRTFYNGDGANYYGKGTRVYNVFITSIICILQDINNSIDIIKCGTIYIAIDQYILALCITENVEHFKDLTHKMIYWLSNI